MSTTDDTVPAAETERAEHTPISDLLPSQTADRHEGHVEVGGNEPEAAPVAEVAAPAAQPAPVAETKTDPAAKPEREQPFWYRKEIEKERKARQQAEARAAQLEQRPAPQRQTEGEQDDPDRPLTRAELEFYRQQDALFGRLERSEERFVDKLGDETFEATKEWLATRPDIEEWALKQRDPWKAAHSQFQKEKLASEIGEDPNAWREQERERIRQEILAEQAAQDQHQPAPRPAPQMRPAPPAPASTVRSAPRDDGGRFTGQQPLGSVLKHKFG